MKKSRSNIRKMKKVSVEKTNVKNNFLKGNKIFILLLVTLTILLLLNLTFLYSNYKSLSRMKGFNDKSYDLISLVHNETIEADITTTNLWDDYRHFSDNKNHLLYDMYVVVFPYENLNEFKYYNIGAIAKNYLYFSQVTNDIINKTPIVIMFCPTFNLLSVFDRRLDGELLTFQPAAERQRCSEYAEWTMFMDQNDDEFEILFGSFIRNYFNHNITELNGKKVKLKEIHFKVMNEEGVLTLNKELGRAQ